MKKLDIALFREIKLFSSMTDTGIRAILNAPENFPEEYERGKNIYRQGEPGPYMYIVLEGVVEMVTGSKWEECVVATVKEGDFFGEDAIMTDKPTQRTATARVGISAKVFKIHKKYVLEAAKLAGDIKGKLAPDEVRDAILKLPIFSGLTQDEIQNFREWALVESYKEDSIIYSPGIKAESIYVVLSGKIELLKQDEQGNPVLIANEVAGEYFGEMALMPGGDGIHNHYARVTEFSKLIKISKDIFTALLDRDKTLVDKIKIVQNLRQMKLKKPGSKTPAQIKPL
jgi:cAMP-binding proteins - catabolite gene activator and regulatory subunit of cAMP-dependent protein kinases